MNSKLEKVCHSFQDMSSMKLLDASHGACSMTCVILHLNFVLSFANREPIIEFDLHLHGNKRNERNEMYRRRLTDEVDS